MILESTLNAWSNWVAITKLRCHLHFNLEGGTVESHIATCRKGARDTVTRIVKDLPASFEPRRILEVGASVGFNSLALAERFTGAEVHGVEPDNEAVLVGLAMAENFSLKYIPVKGVGEQLPYPDNYFDLIICHTVIEHVDNVNKVISEMARVVSRDGVIHIEAPNYIWPYEPHLDVWCIPLLGKKLLRFMSMMQGKRQSNWYVEHLKFVTPGTLERQFKKNGLRWHNRAIDKLHDAAKGSADIKKYRFTAKLLNVVHRGGLGQLFISVISILKLYPSVLYTLRK